MLHSRSKVNGKAVPLVIIAHGLFNFNIHAADSVYQPFKAFKVYHNIVVNAYSQKLFRGLLRKLMPAKGKGMVNFIPAVTGNFNPCIARHGKQGNIVVVAVKHYNKQSIAAACIFFGRPFVNAQNNNILFQIKTLGLA